MIEARREPTYVNRPLVYSNNTYSSVDALSDGAQVETEKRLFVVRKENTDGEG
jgi:hypothetical protein